MDAMEQKSQASLSQTASPMNTAPKASITFASSKGSIKEINARIIVEEISDITNWVNISIQTQKDKSATEQAAVVHKSEFVKCLDNESPLVQISDHEYVKICKIISEDAYIGIGVAYIISKILLYGFYRQICENKWLPSDIMQLIWQFCTVLNVSSIYLDPEYISQQHQLLSKSQENINYIKMTQYKPFISKLRITNDLYMDLEYGEPLSVPSDWECNDDNDNDNADDG